ncbi:response regulator [Kineosporia sp. J2-2]|uniref:Response regulator n=1 Tax=Kineosporia corallincola TaxID=2835133 RepID=A0ABS5TQS8_9ACTN|nr:response regulator [Kineosporia corallincola]MBT0772194.1 response regulator [Kineosporia corallincola]
MAKILVVEDDPDNRLLVEFSLRRLDHDVYSAGSAKEALALIGLHGLPDLALFDIVMDGTDGIGLLSALRRVPTTTPLRAILFTARQLAADERSAAELDAGLLLKPMTSAELCRAVDAALAA